MKPEILDIAPKYKTDKNDHGYIKYYAEHLPATAKKILEIGVLSGESIKMWRELYPEAIIYGLDLFQDNPYPFQDDNVMWFKGSQGDSKLLDDLRIHAPFDLIIEDGGHQSRLQWITFFGLVDCCDLYVLEDAHTTEEFWRQGMKYENTMLAMMKSGRFPFKHHLYLDKISFIYGDNEKLIRLPI